ncbi:hypothetical protein N7493_003853 [Penicillium malachiteum]|uniref:Uncharacterized protein n=1 Tax=Penicillium malachiteum TaxID=1324776 RepID=A0AAD6HR06_9EURO|nr:hypothetical protein N7493_003853 [Penicillium malachiteum]
MEEGAAGEQSSHCIQYRIEWRVTLNDRVVAKDTEQNLVQMPSFHWPQIQTRVNRILRGKIAYDWRVRPDDMTVMASVNDRSQHDLTKRFDSTYMDWTAIEKQLLMWTTLYHLGKEVRLDISLNYTEDNSLSLRHDKQGKMILQARPRCGETYIKRCGALAHLVAMKVIEKPVKYVEQGGVLETHDDIPDSLREQLYAEENERSSRQKSHYAPSGPLCPPINITILPNQGSHPLLTDAIDAATPPSKIATPDILEIPGFHDVAMEEYSDWQ